VVEFDIKLQEGLANGTRVSNQAILTASRSFRAESDDPNVNGVSDPDNPNDQDPTDVIIQTPGPLTKMNAQSTATIGEQFEYTIIVPATATTAPLYDVQILDTLPANLRYVGARVVTGGAWTLSNTSTTTNIDNKIILEDTVTGIDIPANGQARVAIMVELRNSAPNQGSVIFNNSASYTYNRANGVDSTQLAGGAGTTANMTVVEPLLTATKTMSFVTPAGKAASEPATVGDVIEYKVTIPNSGTSTAFDTNIVDTLPANVALVVGSAAAALNGVAVTSFVADPFEPSGTTLVWGRENGDGSLYIPAGQSLVLTYQVRVVDASSIPSFTNRAYVDWTSLDEDYPLDPDSNPAPGRERTGAGCGTSGIVQPNDYCTGPAAITIYTVDNTSIAKSVYADSYAETPASTTDPIVRVGDTITYDLTLNLQEYTTQNVAVEDTLPVGMTLQSFTIIGGPNFSYTLGVQPVADATGTLRWEFGDIINTPSNNNTPIDALVIRYVAKVVTAAPAVGVDYTTVIPLDNLAKLFYFGGDPALYPTRLTATERVEVRQPLMTPITKVDQGSGRVGTGTEADPYLVNIATDVMSFRLESCNDGLAPAYGVQFTDLLASQFNESNITPPVVTVGGTLLTAGTNYIYTPPVGRGGTMSFVLSAPVNPSECVTVAYNIGFHSDIAAGQKWSNEAKLPQYASLPVAGRLYDSSAALAQVWMSNPVIVQPLSKTLMSPVEATIGEEVVYQITVPAVPMNAALDNVVVSDTLHGALEYVSASVAAPFTLIDDSSAPGNVRLTIASIPAGQQAIITLRARVVNNDQANNNGVGITNTASYTYTGIPDSAVTSGSSDPLTIVEPSVTVTKSVTSASPPIAGAILTYTVNLKAKSGVEYSNAFDLVLADTLGTGLAYVIDSTKINGSTAANPAINGQILTWSGIDIITEGADVSITYDVRVLDSVGPSQLLRNDVRVEWTGLPGANVNERTGTGTPVDNDYFATAFTELTTLAAGAPSKVTLQPTATIGEQFTYRISVPATAATTTLYDVRIQDSLAFVDSAADLRFAGVTKVSGPGDPVNIGTTTNLIIADAANNGIDIPAGQQLIFDVTVELLNTTNNGASLSFQNTATYTYNKVNGDNTTSQSGGTSGPVSMMVVEPKLTATKSATNATPGKAAADPITGGDIIQYVVTINNSGTATAYDVNVADILPPALVFYSGYIPVATATINGSPVSDFVALPAAPLVWGRGNGDGSLDIPANGTLVLTYRAQVLESAATTFTNQVWVDWTSLDGLISNAEERTGAGCPNTTAPNGYCSPASVTTTTVDNNGLTKLIFADTYDVVALSNTADKIVRIGDTATYRLTLRLGEGTTRSVKVQDELPAGMAFGSQMSITLSNGNPFTYSGAPQPTQSDTALFWDLGTVDNAADNNAANDFLIIEYTANVLLDAGIAQTPSTNLVNTATLSYQDASGVSVVKPVASDTLTLHQPLMSAIVKSDRLGRVGTAATPLNVNVAADIMQFRLESCNTTGLAPAYNVQISDALASQLNIASLVLQSVAVGGAPLAAGDYSYTPPALRGGTMLFALNTPVNPGQCVTIDYNIGFHTDFGPNQTWKNSATLDEYWSLPAKLGQRYTPTGVSQFYMTNVVSVQPLTKTLTSAPEATIGETVTYQITVPSVSAALDNVVVSDTLHGALEYVSASAALVYLDSNGTTITESLSIIPTQSGQTLTWNFGTIPAGQQAVIELTARVANNDQANAGTSIINTASYTYTDIPTDAKTSGDSAPLTIVEPSVTMTKSVKPETPPQAGDILTYTVNLTATAGDNFSDAFDAGLVDTLSLGLAYLNGTATVNGVDNTIIDPASNGGDGITTPQTLTWDLAGSTADIDIVEGTTVTVSYQVRVLDTVVAGQVLTNNVTGQWIGLDVPNTFERNYGATAAAPPLTVPIPTLTLQKVVTKLSGTTEVIATTANPGDRLRYTLTIQNPTAIQLVNFSLIDVLERLNATPMFQADKIVMVAVPPERPDGTGPKVAISADTLSITGLNIAAKETLTIVFDTLLRTDLKSGTVVLNQAELQGPWSAPIKSDDPNVPGVENPTQTVIPANGVVYDAELRKPLGGMTLTLRLAATGADLPVSCFVDPSQQNQVTPANGEYNFDLKFNPTDCPENADYLIAVTAVTG
jgi:fimbrial isopeptide formation D2 family protein/uncharacterized repeat protein (TIGR01451 family)